MGKKSKRNSDAVVVPASPGPLGAWRLSLAVAVAALSTGMPLMAAATTGKDLDIAAVRSFAVACFVWIAAGRVNRILVDVEHRRSLEATVADVDDEDAESDTDLSTTAEAGAAAA